MSKSMTNHSARLTFRGAPIKAEHYHPGGNFRQFASIPGCPKCRSRKVSKAYCAGGEGCGFKIEAGLEHMHLHCPSCNHWDEHPMWCADWAARGK